MDEVRIFISYAREDEARVKQLYQRLADAGFQPWLDREHIIPGMRWEPVIKKALKQSDFVLVCLSATSINKRGFLQREIKQALEQSEEKLEHDVYLIPARLDDCKVPDVMSEIQWVDLFEDDGWRWLLKAIEYGLKQRGKTMPTPVSSAARTETATPLPLPSDSSPEKTPADSPSVAVSPPQEKKAPPPQQEKKAPLPSPIIVTPPQQEETPPNKQVESFAENLNGVPLEMIFVPGGTFKMGSPKGEGDKNERPQHDVTVPDFYMGKYQVTQSQWKAVMGKNPSHFKGRSDLPVENISWDDAEEFCEKLSQMTGKEYRFPSEAEWEYACRSGTTGDYAGDLDAMAWYRKNSDRKSHPVGRKQPNAFGLYDMHGNVREWCCDIWHEGYKNAPTDGSAWFGRTSPYVINRVIRGGSWDLDEDDCRSASRDVSVDSGYYSSVGVRVVVSSKALP